MTQAAAERKAVAKQGASLSAAELDHVLEARLEHLISVDQPLVMVSQIPRSGGTLLMRLLDGHPRCHTMPHEFGMRWGTPELLVGSPQQAWETLVDRKVAGIFKRGYTQANSSQNRTRRAYPFLLPPSLQRALFEKCLEGLDETTERAVVNAYLTSYFNAWLDNQNLYGRKKEWITAFAPRMAMNPRKVDRFDAIYPDGRIISLVRDPRSWFASARTWSMEWSVRERAVELWCEATRVAIDQKKRFGDRMYVIGFDDLVMRTRESMRAIADYLSIPFVPELLVPSFNRLRIKANSSFEVKGYSVISEPIDRYRQVLSKNDIAYVERVAIDLYEEVRELRPDALKRAPAEPYDVDSVNAAKPDKKQLNKAAGPNEGKAASANKKRRERTP